MYKQISKDDNIPVPVVKALSKIVIDESLRHAHVAVALRKRKVVAVGKNTTAKTHTLQAEYAKKANMHEKQFPHAELAALIKCKFKADEMYVFRIKNGKWLYSKPCPVCQLAIAEVDGLTCFHS